MPRITWKVDTAFIEALAAGFRMFMQFVGASNIDFKALAPATFYRAVQEKLDSP